MSYYTPLRLSPTPKASWLRSVRARLLLRRVGLDTGKRTSPASRTLDDRAPYFFPAGDSSTVLSSPTADAPRPPPKGDPPRKTDGPVILREPLNTGCVLSIMEYVILEECTVTDRFFRRDFRLFRPFQREFEQSPKLMGHNVLRILRWILHAALVNFRIELQEVI